MGHTLIIAEKPRAAARIAAALADGEVTKKGGKGVSSYSLTRKGQKIVVAAAVGHIYSLRQNDKQGWVYPVFNVDWAPAYEVRKDGAYTKKYLTALKAAAKGAERFVVACDFDIEGSVIGFNVLRFACKKKDGARMHFSTLTKHELEEAFEKANPSLDWGMVEAGLTRHVADWFFGINLSRALTLAIKNAVGMFKVMSTGRVQGPTLAILCERELEIRAFEPTPFWQLELHALVDDAKIVALHAVDKFWKEDEATTAHSRSQADPGVVQDVSRKEFKQAVPPPFDLTSLQSEAYKQFGFPPTRTQELAQTLYESGLISYPRTSSQKLPERIGFIEILKGLASLFPKEVEILLGMKKLVPKEGKKEDPAHPAIYPTGEKPKMLTDQERKLFDLIAHRFLAVFGEPAIRESLKVTIRVGEEDFIAEGKRTVEPNWHTLYGPFAKFEEVLLPDMCKGQEVDVQSIDLLSKETQPPKRFSPASLVKRMEKENIGTKATRAATVDTLSSRGYVTGDMLEVTELGLQLYSILTKYSPRILDVELTRQFEDDMARIQERKTDRKEVLERLRSKLEDILMEFKSNEDKIGQELADAIRATNRAALLIGPCPVCGNGDVRIIRSKKSGKRFAGCSNYPACSNSYPLPQRGDIIGSKKPCPTCNHPIITVKGGGRRPWRMCLNMECPSRERNGEDGGNNP